MRLNQVLQHDAPVVKFHLPIFFSETESGTRTRHGILVVQINVYNWYAHEDLDPQSEKQSLNETESSTTTGHEIWVVQIDVFNWYGQTTIKSCCNCTKMQRKHCSKGANDAVQGKRIPKDVLAP